MAYNTGQPATPPPFPNQTVPDNKSPPVIGNPAAHGNRPNTVTTPLYGNQAHPAQETQPPLTISSTLRPRNHHTLPIDDQVLLDHKEITNYYKEYEKRVARPDEAVKWYHQFAWAVARHSAAEELILYPLFEAHLGDYGRRCAESNRAEHMQVKLILTELEDTSHHLPEFSTKMKELMMNLEHHMQHEENEELVKLREVISEPDRVTAGVSFERRKMIVSTRPHPMTPEQPAFLESLVEMMAAPVDKLRDLFRTFPTPEEIEKVKPTDATPSKDDALRRAPL